RNKLASWLQEPDKGTPLGFIPTMGALHEGHLSLISAAKNQGRTTLASIFVNPRQFNNPDDLLHYPRTISSDIQMLRAAGCDAVFIPNPGQVYRNDVKIPLVELGSIGATLEGSYRPGHFQGVIDVLWSLFHDIQPDDVYFGAKDFQQCMVVQKLLNTHFQNIRMHIVPTQREPDGLAMSSRNKRLSPEARAKAPAIIKALQRICAEKQEQPLQELISTARDYLLQNDIQTEYLELANPETLESLNDWSAGPQVLLYAGYLEGVRLIDNLQC
ncbi:MAG: hypothetical protein RL160_1846, partial [Bacteroidota bacterium]